MFAIKRTIKYLFSKLITLKFLERLSQNKIWREILEEKKPKIVSSAIGKLDEDSWNSRLRYKVWDKIPEYIDTNEDILYIEFGVWKGLSINYLLKNLQTKIRNFMVLILFMECQINGEC